MKMPLSLWWCGEYASEELRIMRHSFSCSPSIDCSFTLSYACPPVSQLELLPKVQGYVHLHISKMNSMASTAPPKLAIDASDVLCCCASPEPLNGGHLCRNPDECKVHNTAASDPQLCPRFLRDTWGSLPGFSPGTNEAMACRANGKWLAPGVERFYATHQGLNRSAAFRISRDRCLATHWTYSKFFSRGPAIIGSDSDIKTILHRNKSLNLTRLTLRMGRPFALWRNDSHVFNATNAGRLYTTCENIAFIMCAVRGWLHGGTTPGLVFLATSGSEIGKTCNTCGACRPDLSWDECWITKNEFCMLSAICVNGDEIWHRPPGLWQCKLREAVLHRLAPSNVLL